MSTQEVRPDDPAPGSEPGELPFELTYTPVPLVAITGLNAQDTRHALIWNTFTVNRQPDRIPLYFKLVSDAHDFSAQKPKKTSYEWHIPKGILKSKWISKHLFEIPSVAVLFIELDWFDPRWNEKRMQIITKCDQLRCQLSGRSTRIALVLIQSSATPGGEEWIINERAALLCQNCDLPANSLFVLPFSDDVQQMLAYVVRIESTIHELSKAYYDQKAKTVKMHRDGLSKTTHQLLFVRHQFKMAFYSEIRQEITTAIKHYKQAYAHLLEIRATVVNIFEIKVIAGFISYKICKLAFQANAPLDSISHFRKHIEVYRNKSEPQDLEFEHHAWLSKQYATFAALFDYAVSSGLIPSQTQNPGFYSYEAATETSMRRDTARTNLKFHLAKAEYYKELLANLAALEFFGQRPWRPGVLTLESGDIDKEKEGIQALQWQESLVSNYSSTIIPLLVSAAAHFKKNKCPRMMRYVTVLAAEEHSTIGDYTNSLNYFTQVLPYYRTEPWKPLMSSILVSALKAAYFSSNLVEYIKLSLELVEVDSHSGQVFTREDIQSALDNVIQGRPPQLFDGELLQAAENGLLNIQLSESETTIS
ncbi:Trafficking protein particle complex subunit 11 [Halotydeus destructor]|nr:Trafficking protein particle complex subunit 11 [Halotydeus destructor]